MSAFTRFDGEEQLVYNKAASDITGKDLWATRPGFRYYVGHEDSSVYVDVESGFLTDGATIPRFLWWLLPPIGEYTQCTTLHDKLCTTYYVIELIDGTEYKVFIDRKRIDEILQESMDVKNVTPWKKKVIMAGVNIHRFVRNPKTPKPVALVA